MEKKVTGPSSSAKSQKKGSAWEAPGALTTRAQLLLSKELREAVSTQHLGSRGFKDGSGSCTHEASPGQVTAKRPLFQGALDHTGPALALQLFFPSLPDELPKP